MGGIEVPGRLAWLHQVDGGAAWLAALPDLVAEACDRWTLVPGPVFGSGNCSWAAPATCADGSTAVLKVGFPHWDGRHEADALARWNGAGAVRLLGRAPGLGALLLERGEPGTHLADRSEGVDAVGVLLDLARRLAVPVTPSEPFGSLAEEVAGWGRGLHDRWDAIGRPGGRRPIDAAAAIASDLAGEVHTDLLVNQDLHPGNVLAATREPWLAIDPKPLAGELAFAAVPIVRALELPGDPASVVARLDRCADELAVDRARVRDLTLLHTVAWALGSEPTVQARHLATASILCDA